MFINFNYNTFFLFSRTFIDFKTLKSSVEKETQIGLSIETKSDLINLKYKTVIIE